MCVVWDKVVSTARLILLIVELDTPSVNFMNRYCSVEIVLKYFKLRVMKNSWIRKICILNRCRYRENIEICFFKKDDNNKNKWYRPALELKKKLNTYFLNPVIPPQNNTMKCERFYFLDAYILWVTQFKLSWLPKRILSRTK